MPAREIAASFSGEPSLLVSSQLVDGRPDEVELGFPVLVASVADGGVGLFRAAGRTDTDDLVEIHQLPADLIAIVATPDDAEPLGALWSGQGLATPVIVVERLAEATGQILACARAELAAASARCEELQRGLVATRAEFEETRTAMRGVMRTLSHRYATKMNLVALAAPSPDATITVGPEVKLSRTYPVGTELMTCLALHVSGLHEVETAALTVVLFGVESGRALGKWRRPAKALSTGWNMFDFPQPVAAVRETVAVEVSLEGAAGSAVIFSLSEQSVGAEPALAVRIWTADAGGRFPYAEHWVWEVGGAARPPSGLVSLVGAGPLARVMPRGRVEAVRSGDRDAPTLTYLLGGGSALLHLPDLTILGLQGVRLELEHRFGNLNATRFELVVQSPQHCFGSGSRSFEDGATPLMLGLSLPVGLPDVVDLYLLIESDQQSRPASAGVALGRMEAIAGERNPPSAGPRATRIYPEAWQPSGSDPDAPRFASLKAMNFSQSDTNALFEVVIDDLAFGRRLERSAKFKIGRVDGRLALEFRQGPHWPNMFREWPGRERDRFSELFRVRHVGGRLAIPDALGPGPDQDLLAALTRLMPTIVATGVLTFPEARGQIPDWLEAAHLFAAAGRATFGEQSA